MMNLTEEWLEAQVMTIFRIFFANLLCLLRWKFLIVFKSVVFRASKEIDTWCRSCNTEQCDVVVAIISDIIIIMIMQLAPDLR